MVASPYREITRPIVDYVKRLRRESPRDIVTVYVPEYVVGHWWEQLLHNQSALRLKTRLLMQPGVVVASVPYQLRSATHQRPAQPAADGRAGTGGPDGDGQALRPPGGAAAEPVPAVHRLTAGTEELHAADLQAECRERGGDTDRGDH